MRERELFGGSLARPMNEQRENPALAMSSVPCQPESLAAFEERIRFENGIPDRAHRSQSPRFELKSI